MFSSLIEFFAAEKKSPHSRKQRRSSSLPTILFPTTCIDFEPLSPLTTTDPINVPFTYHDYGKTYSSSLESLSTSRTNSLASSSSPSSYGSPTTPSSSMSDDDDDDPLPLAFTTPPPTDNTSTSSVDPSSCGDMNCADHPISAAALKSIPSKIESKIITKLAPFESIRHSLCLFMSPSFTSMPSTAPPVPTAPTITTTVCDNVLYQVEENHTIATNHPIPDHRNHYPHPFPMYTRSLRENPDHLRQIVSELNMMRVNKLISPLRPRAILLERSDPFIPSTPSPLRHAI